MLDSGSVVAICSVTSVVSVAAGWVGKHFVQDVMSGSDQKPKPVSMADLEAALARHEVRMLDRFNGRYPSKEVFEGGMRSVGEQLAETRKYIGDAKRELAARIHDLESARRESR